MFRSVRTLNVVQASSEELINMAQAVTPSSPTIRTVCLKGDY
jgi:hypothetical protein